MSISYGDNMKIGLDLRMAGGGSGIARYIQELTTRILDTDKVNQYVLFFNKLTPELENLYRKYDHQMVATGISHYSAMEQIKFPFILRKYNLDLVHFPHFNVPVLYRGKYVITIHDLTHTKFPGRKKSRVFHRLAYNLILINALRKAKRIIAVSNNTKQEIKEYFSFVPESKIDVVYEGVSEHYQMMNKDEAFEKVKAKFKLTKPFLLYVGVWRRYKNLPMLAQAFDRLADEFDFELVLAGEPDPFYPEIKEQVLAIKHKDRIKAVGRVTDDDLKILYNAADLFIMPSLLEGFGLPPLEAAACGTPSACSDIPTLREVMGQAAEYFDPENLDNMTEVLRILLKNPVRMEELANLGLKRAVHFNWKEAAKNTINVYEAIR